MTKCFRLCFTGVCIIATATPPLLAQSGSETETVRKTYAKASQLSSSGIPISGENQTYPAQSLPGCVPRSPPSSNDSSTGIWTWGQYPVCAWVRQSPRQTPLLIDTDGSGYHMTSAKNGLLWDFLGDGHPRIRIAGTASGSTNGWLAIDLNGNGKIDSARELFSIASYHIPKSWRPDQINGYIDPPPGVHDVNGFNSLIQCDLNLDGVIDNKDTDWLKLLVWIDKNHDGISQPDELHHLDDLGIRSISLHYERSKKIDRYGNKFELKGTINGDNNPDDVNRSIYDVVLVGEPQIDFERSAKNPIC